MKHLNRSLPAIILLKWSFYILSLTAAFGLPCLIKADDYSNLPGAGKIGNQAIPYKNAEIPVLCYHEIASDRWAEEKKDPYILGLSDFHKQINWLANEGYQTISLQDYHLFITGRKRFYPPKKPILITFDDGRKSFKKHAFPYLNKAGFKAVLFIFPEATGHKYFLTWDDLKMFQENGYEIEGHGYTHNHLHKLSRSSQLMEFEKTKKSILKNLKKEIQWLAYPYGTYNTDSLPALKDSHFTGAFTVFSGGNPAGQDPFFSSRYLIKRKDTMEAFQNHVKKRGLHILSAAPERGSLVRKNEEITVQINGRFRKENLRLESGPYFEAKNKKRQFEYDEKNGILKFKAADSKGDYLIINIQAADEKEVIHHASLLYLWKR